jgi:hypothetical protein
MSIWRSGGDSSLVLLDEKNDDLGLSLTIIYESISI